MYLNNGGVSWTNKARWLGTGDHCDWDGVTCSSAYAIEGLALPSNQMLGAFPSDLSALSSLQTLNVADNAMEGSIPNDLCTSQISNSMYIYGDAANCPNDFSDVTGQYLSCCCDNVLINLDMYLNEFATAVLGDSNCSNLEGTENIVCSYMIDKANHSLFGSGYPYDFNGDVWMWLKVSKILYQRKLICKSEYATQTSIMYI